MPRFFGICICFLSLAAITWTNALNDDDDAVRRGNDYVDELLSDMFEENNDYDPYRMDDSVIGFHKKVVFVNVSGEAKLHDGTIKGLKTLHRSGDCILEDNGEKLTVKADLGAGALNFFYAGTAKFMNFGPTISVNGDLAYIEVYLEFTVDSETGKNGKLTKFVIDDMRGMKVWISGLGPINWAVNPIISGVTKVFKRFVRNFMENRVRTYIAERIPDYQFPVEGGRETEAPSSSATPEDTTPQPETPITEPETSTQEETSTSPETETPTLVTEESTPTPETSTTVAEESTPTTETSTPVPEESTPTTETPTSLPEESTPTTETPTSLPEESTPTTETPTPLPEESTPTSETPTPVPEESTPTPETPTPVTEEEPSEQLK